jgi:DnaJ like chaperone protein
MSNPVRLILRILLFVTLAVVGLGMFKVVKHGVIQYDSSWAVYLFALSFWGMMLRWDYKSGLKKKIKKEEYKVENEEKYNQIFLSIISHLLDFDSNSKDEEFKFIEKSFLRFFSEKKTDYLIASLIKDHLENKIDLEALCIAALTEFSESELDQMMYLIIGIATADKVLSNNEEAILIKIIDFTQFSKERYQSILAQFSYKTEERLKREKEQKKWDGMNWEERGQHHKEKERQRFANKKPLFSIEQAFDILELKSSATLKEVKKKFKKLAMKYHPDRLTGLGEEHIKIGEEKFKQLVDAYEILKRYLG